MLVAGCCRWLGGRWLLVFGTQRQHVCRC